ncbi:DUF1330 domain-containing protein [Paraglaciecola aquimarina]|uniref:DUF1330 domain-containing protein n=1 Tax=Paraglaciecola algarum TaxID=3050085 RepID=A0ABS9D578_9ALTE|nr:DUF1330 domain-containing protein [Paraglaciecola sp. G1-23]MCF2947580.1 DUF1330 domain-containing protein [Paraglaciecola sp. G1-23]
MKGYWVVRADVSDMEKFKQYAAIAPTIIDNFSGRYLARAGEFSAVEGSARSRNTIIEFPSYQQALDCWHSVEYQGARKIRLGVAELDILIVQGLL